MFLDRKYISRRLMLRGMGAAVALPLLESMVPAQTPLRRTSARPRARLACIEMVHGAAGSSIAPFAKHYWSPEKEGADFDFSYTLSPLAPLRKYLTIVSGTDARPAEALAPSEGGADHFRSSAVFLTGAHARQTAGADIWNGISIDQIYAGQVGGETRLPSIRLSIENFGLSGSCGFNYNCAYSETISWAAPSLPLPMTPNPRVVFEQLFADIAPRRNGAKLPNSILDAVSPDVARLNRVLPAGDRSVLDGWLDEIRAVERRIEEIEKQNAAAPDRELPSAPLGVPDSWERHVKLMFDLQVLAFRSEVTRVSAFKMSRDTSNRIFPESGVKIPFHTLSHHSEREDLIAEFALLNRYHVGFVAYFLNRLKETPDGDGNLLDHSLVLYGSPMGDSNTHNHRRLPLFLAGHAAGRLQGNLHRVCPPETPLANCLLTVLHKLGVDLPAIGDSTGEISI